MKAHGIGAHSLPPPALPLLPKKEHPNKTAENAPVFPQVTWDSEEGKQGHSPKQNTPSSEEEPEQTKEENPSLSALPPTPAPLPTETVDPAVYTRAGSMASRPPSVGRKFNGSA